MHRLAFSVLTASAIFASATPALAQSGDVIQYRVKQGDTLLGLAERYFTKSAQAAQVQKINRIANPRTLPVGKVLSIPRSYLQYDTVPLQIQSFSGDVSLTRSGRETSASVGTVVVEGTIIETGRRGFVALTGSDGTRVTLPTNSRARVDSTRRYKINGALDVDLKILKGRGNIKAPKIGSDGRFQVGTPVAVTAVRGTEFRVSHDPETGRAITEVVEGDVNVSAGENTAHTSAGFGVAAGEQGVGSLEKLLPAPRLVDAGDIQTAPVVAFSIQEMRGARAYRTQVARDAGFLEIIAETVGEGTQATFADIADGRLFVRSRAVAESGIEGLSESVAFRRKRVGAAASADVDAMGLRFVWMPQGEGQAYQAFQLWRDGAEDRPLVDEVGLTEKGILVSDLAPGQYTWRIGTFQIDEGDIIKVWEPAQTLTVTE